MPFPSFVNCYPEFATVDKALKMNKLFAFPHSLPLLFPLFTLICLRNLLALSQNTPQQTSAPSNHRDQALLEHQCHRLRWGCWGPREEGSSREKTKSKGQKQRNKGFASAAILRPGLRAVVCHWEAARKKFPLQECQEGHEVKHLGLGK